MLEVIVNPQLGTQALNERQVALAELHAIFTLRVITAQPELKAITVNPLPGQHLSNNLRHRLMLKNTLMAAVRQVRQMRRKTELVTRQAPARVALGYPIHQAMNAMPLIIEAQVHLAMQQALQIDIRLLADQLKFKPVRLADGLGAVEREHLEVTGRPIQGQGKCGLVGRSEHPVFLCEGWAADSAPAVRLAERCLGK